MKKKLYVWRVGEVVTEKIGEEWHSHDQWLFVLAYTAIETAEIVGENAPARQIRSIQEVGQLSELPGDKYVPAPVPAKEPAQP